jgi:hypothetical protein
MSEEKGEKEKKETIKQSWGLSTVYNIFTQALILFSVNCDIEPRDYAAHS